MSKAARKAILAAGFVPPFKVWSPELDWVVDSNPARAIVAVQEDMCEGPFIPRGWGCIQYMPHGEALFDAWESAFYSVVGMDEDDIDEVVRKLNEVCELGEEVSG